ncbi:MAG: hypothetical protein IJR71_02425 [Prevotella sp.]|nr:hypothetical protein [Prevotella sp.]
MVSFLPRITLIARRLQQRNREEITEDVTLNATLYPQNTNNNYKYS